MSKRLYIILLISIMIAAALVDNALKGVLPLWVRVPMLGLLVGLAVLVVNLVLKRTNKQKG